MKKFTYLFLIVSFLLTLSSCLKPKHSIRVNNQFSRALSIIIGPDNFGKVAAGNTSSYQSVPEGSNALGGDLTGSVSISGKGKHKWTLTITSAGTFSIAEDK